MFWDCKAFDRKIVLTVKSDLLTEEDKAEQENHVLKIGFVEHETEQENRRPKSASELIQPTLGFATGRNLKCFKRGVYAVFTNKGKTAEHFGTMEDFWYWLTKKSYHNLSSSTKADIGRFINAKKNKEIEEIAYIVRREKDGSEKWIMCK